jgi:CHAD domain-containing protein
MSDPLLSNLGAVETIGGFAHSLIQRQVKKIAKLESDVVHDLDPEALHQMRVSLRRLRTVVRLYGGVLKLPKDAQESRLQWVAIRLGALRDVDVLLDLLSPWIAEWSEHSGSPDSNHGTQTHKQEFKAIQTIVRSLQRNRGDRLKRVRHTLRSSHYRSMQKALQRWIADPTFHPVAAFPVNQALPDIWMLLISQLLLHPGWLFCTEETEGGDRILSEDPTHLQTILTHESRVLHSLRKQMKRVRYQTEFMIERKEAVTPGDSTTPWQDWLDHFKRVQDALGQLQDSYVLRQFLQEALGNHWQRQLPDIAQRLATHEHTAWTEWRSQQQYYLLTEFRQQLRHNGLHPDACQRPCFSTDDADRNLTVD